jgi:predicted HTH transcriptional regulator
VQFREISKLFITSFEHPSFGESVDKAVVTTQETTQEKIIACLKAEPTLTRKLLAQRVGLSEGGVKYHLNKLKGLGFFFCPPCPPVFLENQRKEKKRISLRTL